ncbi:MAG: hypothetical protein LH467_03720 [Gemmatimonadaceae bacterium]|nr:hypothetical protein [Gemmatimonadaceae bacterium]
MRAATTTASIGLVALAVTTGLLALVFRDEAGRRAVLWSAGIAAAVQVVAFGAARLAPPAKVFKVWAGGAALRMLTLVVHALLLLKPLGLQPMAALLSLAALLFVTTVLESWLLTS